MSGKDNLSEISNLLNGFTMEDSNVRINSMKKLHEIADAIGEERTRKELIPFVTEICSEDEDEVISEFAIQLESFVPKIGGSEFLPCLIPSLEMLCKVEEGSVRELVITCGKAFLEIIKNENLSPVMKKFWYPMIKKLAENPWHCARGTSCAFFAGTFPLTGKDNQKTLKSMYLRLCSDRSPLVRRHAVKFMGSFARSLPLESVYSKKNNNDTLFSVFEKLRTDKHDSVRLLTVITAIDFCEILGQPIVEDVLVNIVKTLGRDSSWRVRYLVAEEYSRFCKSIGKELTAKECITLYCKLCIDKESEVRVAAASELYGVCEMLDKDMVIANILPTVKKLVTDKSEHVRSALGGVVMGLSKVLGKDATIKYLLDHFVTLLKDEFPTVRLNLISKLQIVNNVIGPELLSGSGLLPSICELAEDKQWRVRLSIIQHVPSIAKVLGKKYFNDKLKKLCVTWLSDSVFSIRVAASENIVELIKLFGEEWAMQYILPEALKMKEFSNYLYRMVVLFLISGCCRVCSKKIIMTMLPTALEMATDPVNNIKFNCAKTLGDLATVLDKEVVVEKIRPVLLQLQRIEDPDVQNHAKNSLKKIDG